MLDPLCLLFFRVIDAIHQESQLEGGKAKFCSLSVITIHHDSN